MRTDKITVALTTSELKQILKQNISLTLKNKLKRKLEQLQNKNKKMRYEQLKLVEENE